MTEKALFSQGHALLIGVGSHQSREVQNIPQTVRDAQTLAQVLCDPQYCGYPQEQVQVLHDAGATREGILQALDRLAERTNEDHTVFIFYSGHGDYSAEGNYYLVSHDAQVKDEKVVDGSGVSQGALLERLSKIKAKRVLIILNACHAGELSPILSLGAKNPPNTLVDALLGSGSGRFIITACQEEQVSYVGNRELTLFAWPLVEGLKGKNVVARGGLINVYDLYLSVFEKVTQTAQKEHHAQQQPELTVLKGVGPMAIALYRGATQTNMSLAELDSDLLEDTAVRAVDEKRAKRMYNTIIGQYVAGNAIDTGGGAYIAGNVTIKDGDFVGRDKIIYGDEVHGDKVGGDKITVGDISGSSNVAIGKNVTATFGAASHDLSLVFQPVQAAIKQTLVDALRPSALDMVRSIQREAEKGSAAQDQVLAGLIAALAGMAPGAKGALAQAFQSPQLSGIGGRATGAALQQLAGR